MGTVFPDIIVLSYLYLTRPLETNFQRSPHFRLNPSMDSLVIGLLSLMSANSNVLGYWNTNISHSFRKSVPHENH